MVAVGAYAIYLNQQIIDKFEGKRWSLPARVYARAMVVYQGQNIYLENLLYELSAANYRRFDVGSHHQVAREQGSFSYKNGVLTLHSREFAFWDKLQSDAIYKIKISNNTIDNIVKLKPNSASEKITLLRLDPAQIGRIYPQQKQDRDLVAIDNVPANLLKALVLVEDQKFFEHIGIRPLAIVRALWQNIKAGRTVQGGSTITQQLVKNLFLDNSRQISRKLNDMLMAILLEAHYSKKEILQTYINEVYVGQDGATGVRGFALGAKFYFDKNLNDTNLSEQALLVALIKGANYYNPRKHPKRALARRNLVLEIMYKHGIINQQQLANAKNSELGVVAYKRKTSNKYQYFIELVKQQLDKDYRKSDLQTAGLKIFTSLSPSAQWQLQQAASSHINQLQRKSKVALQTGAVLTDSNSGKVLALVGSKDSQIGFNRGLNIKRQIGSLIKPAIYLAALNQGYTSASLIADTPFKYKMASGKVWQPQNYGNKIHGLVPIFMALSHSYNLASARLGVDVGLAKVAQVLYELGWSQQIKLYPSMLLGALEASPLQVAQMYQTIAGGGFYNELRALLEVTDNNNKRLTRYGLAPEFKLPAEATYITTYIMQLVNRMGTGKAIGTALPNLFIAGKTGTSNDGRDAWYAGFSGSHLAVVWVGNDENKATNLTGATGALPIFKTIMQKVYQQPLLLKTHANIEWAWLNKAGQRSANKCKDSLALPFIKGTLPEINPELCADENKKPWWQFFN